MSLVIGIDPGFTKPGGKKKALGFALVQTDSGVLIWQHTYKGFDDFMADRARPVCKRAVIQVPIFDGKTPQWNKSAISLVKNGNVSGQLVGYMAAVGAQVQTVPPTRKSGMKMDPEFFKKVFKYDGRCSEHARDAANLAMMWRDEICAR